MTAKVTYLFGGTPPDNAPPATSGELSPAATTAGGAAEASAASAATRDVSASAPTSPASRRGSSGATTASSAEVSDGSGRGPEAVDRATARRQPSFEVVERDESDDDDEEEPMSEGERSALLENVVVRALARKALSEWEVTRLLAANGVEEAEFEVFLDRYRANKYVDDYEFAENLVESLHRRKGFGRSQIKNELAQRHVQPEIISAALDALDDDDELQRAIELAEKRAPSLARLDAATAERRLTSFLMRKGYPSSIIRSAVSAALTPQPRKVRFT